MKLITAALRHPITILVSVLGIGFFSWLAISNTKIDIFPKLGLPTVYVAQPYGGLSPEQMEGFVTSYYEFHFLYITGVKYVESKSIQGAALIKIEFNEGTDMTALVLLLISALLIYRHRGNIDNLLNGKERKLGEKK